ncbi:peptidoglycan DD-metalloendopeptidase family protein [Streptomyces sp. NBC_00259]|uniref:peptidoglycan DD-metalloendopeptidase family protein n=1 Tax=Streptomyces sp. NBC_00259 TaxID=2903643 RepID=UPI002E2E4775|nr:peptidoglycan DD-metalloendopeptidase family protein [Streptomyces sp. NBC_00259]
MAVRGRHRRYQPSRINRASLTVTAGGAGMALPLIGAGVANAASEDVWEKVAACESTGRWHINTGNGHFGGLQFSQSTWEGYGGTAYAPRADLATRDQQIAIAERVLKGQGPRAWPTCSLRAGLTRGGDTPDASQVRQREPGTAPVKRTVQAATPTTVPTQRESYTVARGDSLSGIADSQQVRGGWQALYEANRKVVGDDPDLILPGQRLVLRVTAPRPAAPGRQEAQPKPERRKPQAKPEPVHQAKPKPKPKPKSEPRQEQRQKEQRQKEQRQKEQRGQERTDRSKHTAGFSAPVAAGAGTPYGKAGSSWSSGYHTGVDFPVPTGTSVKAVANGRVVSAGWAGAYGYQIVIRHEDGRYSQYAHLSALTVREGQRVNSGQRIARSGSTGNSTGPHLHFEVRTGPGYGSDIDPLAYLRSGGVGI